ncbi:MAG: lipoyl synthase [Deltaproteobacteria bacterium]|nr:lipoyl synthase [Deltaproteobacteria bacterium]MBI2501482.1 lipoyl synthase [Deltaproteobacteria bacterium]
MELPSHQSHTGRRRRSRLPSWLIQKMGEPLVVHQMKKNLRGLGLHTVCEEARCPNLGECWSRGTATLMILGEVCTRHCGFCSVEAGKVGMVDPGEPENAAAMVKRLGLSHVVITMVARDDLPDGGAAHLSLVIREIRSFNPKTKIETLTSDFDGNWEALERVVEARPDVFNHNIETVESLTPRVRHRATYNRSLDLLSRVKQQDLAMRTKSGLMLGFGEKEKEVLQTLNDLRAVGCELLTIGQYLQPTSKNLPVVEFVRPEVFEEWKRVAEGIGFRSVASGPFVRSSYHAEELVGCR